MLRVHGVITGFAGGPFHITHFFGGTTEGEAAAATAATQAAWEWLEGYIHTALILNLDEEVALINPATGDQTEAFAVTSDVVEFTNTNEPMSLATQGLIRWRTTTFAGGRRLRGRTFVPGVTEDSSVTGSPNAAYMGRLEGMGDILMDSATYPHGGLVVYSRTHGLAAAVSTNSAWNEFAVLRSRRD